MPTPLLRRWVDSLQSRGEYVFTQDQALSAIDHSPASVQRALHRLQTKGRIVRVRTGFFLIVPLEYSSAGAPPVSWFVDPLMKYLGKPYYVAILTAAALHGASHQQPQEFQIMTTRPLRPIVLGRSRVVFFTNAELQSASTMPMKTPTGSMLVSTPETTAVDLVRYYRAAGYLSNVATVLRELAPALDAKKLTQVAGRLATVAEARRLGYLLDHVGATKLTKPLGEWLKHQKPSPAPLRPDRPYHGLEPDRRWGVVANEAIEIEK